MADVPQLLYEPVSIHSEVLVATLVLLVMSTMDYCCVLISMNVQLKTVDAALNEDAKIQPDRLLVVHAPILYVLPSMQLIVNPIVTATVLLLYLKFAATLLQTIFATVHLATFDN
jgi:hypothetical protein